jgi:4-hydroxymandelate oxidase
MQDRELITVDDFRERSLAMLPTQLKQLIFSDYAEATDSRNVQHLRSIALRPRVLQGIGGHDLATTVLGKPITVPIALGPAGGHGTAHPDGEMASARAASRAGTLMIVSMVASFPIEDVAAATSGPVWAQLNFLRDRTLNEQYVHRAEDAGCTAIVLTVDNPGSRALERFDRYRRGMWAGHGNGNPDGIPVANFRGSTGPLVPSQSNLPTSFEPALSWADVHWLRTKTDLPIVIKGIQTAEDALVCVREGIEGVVVSNHGGFALYDARPSAQVLPEVADAVGHQLEIYFDGGIRHGTDVLKCLALGARAVLVARPVFWGLAVDGEDGVYRVLEILTEELLVAMSYCGVANVQSVERSLVTLQQQSHVRFQ